MAVTIMMVFNAACDNANGGNGYGDELEITSGEDGVWTVAEFKRYARSRGWEFTRDGRVIGPCCSGRSVVEG